MSTRSDSKTALNPNLQNFVWKTITITNPYTPTDNYADKQASIIESRSRAVISVPSDYNVAVARFSLSASLVPILLFPVTQNAIDQGVYNINMITVAQALRTPTSLTWTTENSVATVPSVAQLVPGGIQGNYMQFYSMFSLQHFCDMFNTAAAINFAGLTGITSTLPPIMTYDSGTEQFTIWIQTSYTTDGIFIFFDNTLANLFLSTLPLFRLDATKYELLYKNNYNNVVVNPPNSTLVGTFYKMTQEFSNIDSTAWNSLTRLIITSDLPTTSLSIEPNVKDGSQQFITGDNSLNILLDVSINNLRAADGLSYLPQPAFRFIGMNGNAPINTISVNIYLTDGGGNYFPLYLPNGKSADVLLFFCRKDATQGFIQG